MTDYEPYVVVESSNGSASPIFEQRLPGYSTAGVSSITYYLMRGRDVDCASLTYRSWVVTDSPDFSASQYSGTRCGVTALAEIIILETWTS